MRPFSLLIRSYLGTTRCHVEAYRFLSVAGLCVLVGAGVLSGCAQAVLPEEAVVRRVVDGDTIELLDGRRVRYLGIDTPEVRRRAGVGEGWVVDPEPFAEEATAFNRRLIEGRRAHLEYDRQTHDRFGRILAYVYVEDVMVNAELLRAGLAEPLILPPNVKYSEHFQRLAEQARLEQRGLWKDRSAGGRLQ